METTILLVDDHPIVRQGLHLLLDGQGDMCVVGEAGDGQTAIDRVRELNPNVVIMDITLPTLGGVDATRQILAESPETKVIALSIHGDKRFIEEMLQVGAAGYILKDSAPEELVDGVRAVMRGEVVLSAAVTGVVVSEYRRTLSGEQGREGDQDRAAASSIIATKLYRPPVRPDLEPRPRLMERLDQNRRRPLTLIAAPAGYGKTMLASTWLEASGSPCAWVSLDESDNDLQSFASYLLAAVQPLFPGLELKTQSVLGASVLPPAPVLARHLLNDVEKVTEPFILAMDDVHLIRDQAVLDLLSELLRHPSRSMSLVLIGRRDPPLPIASLRAHRQVTEIRAGDLRFTPEEAAGLLGTLLNREIDGATASEWTERTEGWVTGLLLAALSLRHRAETDDMRLDVLQQSAYLQDYLVAEVLANLPPARRDWLLLTSLLDRFCAPLCEAVGRSDAAASSAGLTGIEFIRWLQVDNLFLVPLDERSEWFRFHHLFEQLLQRWLREHLEPDRIAAAHLRAGDWFAKEGLIDEAIRHALAAEDLEAAAHLVERHRYQMMNGEEWPRLRRWMDRLPRKFIEGRPHLLITKAWLLNIAFKLDELPPILERVKGMLGKEDPALGTEERRQLSGEVAALWSTILFWAGHGQLCVDNARHTIEVTPPEHLWVRGVAFTYLPYGYKLIGQLDKAHEVIQNTLAEDRLCGGAFAHRAYLTLLGIELMAGHLRDSEQAALQLRRLAEPRKQYDSLGWALQTLGYIHYQWNDLETAHQYSARAAEMHYQVHTEATAQSSFGLALTYQAMGRFDEAGKTSDAAIAWALEVGSVSMLLEAHSLASRLALLRGEIPDTEHWAVPLGDSMTVMLFPEIPHLTLAWALIARGTSDAWHQASDLLARIRQFVEHTNNTLRLIEVLALQALLNDAQGQDETALSLVEQALTLAEPGGLIRAFADLGLPMADLLRRLRRSGMAGCSHVLPYVERILAAFGSETDYREPMTKSAAAGPSSSLLLNTAEGLIEPLSGRELEVLELLAQRLTYKEIGALLFITPGTVSGHAVRIYSKLQVNNRREAIAKALTLGLLPQR